MRGHPSKADKELGKECRRKGPNVSDRVIQSMKERGALRRPETKVSSYPRGTWRTVDALVRFGWQRKARPATFLAFIEGYPFTEKGVRWSLGTPSGPDRPLTDGLSEDEIEIARHKAAEAYADDVLSSRHPAELALRKMLRTLGVDPVVAANDLALVLLGRIPPMPVEYYEPTTNTFGPAPEPWLSRLAGSDVDSEWVSDPTKVADDIQGFLGLVAAPSFFESLVGALEAATEEQMAAARDEVRGMLDAMPHLAGAEHVFGIAGAFLFALAGVVGTVDLDALIDGPRDEGNDQEHEQT